MCPVQNRRRISGADSRMSSPPRLVAGGVCNPVAGLLALLAGSRRAGCDRGRRHKGSPGYPGNRGAAGPAPAVGAKLQGQLPLSPGTHPVLSRVPRPAVVALLRGLRHRRRRHRFRHAHGESGVRGGDTAAGPAGGAANAGPPGQPLRQPGVPDERGGLRVFPAHPRVNLRGWRPAPTWSAGGWIAPRPTHSR